MAHARARSTEDRGAIRRAYTDKLRQLDPDSDVEGYTRLRNARDHALTLAQSTVSTEVREPVLADEGRDEWLDELGPDQATEKSDGSASSLLPEGEAELPQAPQVVLGILFPAGQTSEEPLARDELAAAEQALAAILEQAESSSIDEQAGIENWLAHHLASAWPRSAWLVEEAALAFGWMEESGQLGERPAVHFLNQRLKGMRFVAKVQQRGHTLHKAWTELAKPGPKGAFAFMRARRDDVRLLLEGIRERYPEVEGHLDPVRVASWEESQEGEPGSVWTTFFILAGVASLIRVCAGALDSSPAPLPPPVAVSPPASVMGSTGWSRDERVLLIHELFGEPILPDTLRNEAPDLWNFLESHPLSDDPFPNNIDAALPSLVQQARLQTQIAAIDADFQSLLAIKQIKLELLRVALTQGGEQACLNFERTLRFPLEANVSPALRERERKLAAQLVENSLFRRTTNQFPQSAAIPGSVVEEVMRKTGFSEETTAAAAQNKGTAAVQCKYRIAVLEAVLRRPSEVQIDLLRML